MLLAFDTASPTVTVALHDGTEVVAAATAEIGMRHGEQLAPLIEQVLAAAGITPAGLTGIAVGVGPGPFTGLRVGLVTARTLGHVLDVPVHGVCSLDALAAEAVASGVVEGEFLVATDARRKEVYLASYDGSGRRQGMPVVERPAVVASDLPVVGEGAALYPESFPNARIPLRPDAGWLARAVIGQQVEVTGPEPLYLRRPDAEIPRAAKAVLPDGAPAR
ncbi:MULTISPECIES: tRNA (adenosine(37)-N6)-threonylcarbamoyltransferase complex dimerization subunit type 1 TsaB [unclassified Nocardioides]|uniref:tRNA (adenosine(37)-N6)-threonylcarbamoyltransferase complex dimerization subunit type 1 TsaB n=1 Tax=unclassified Nocardioides TaxID=2615069 RepID=UPI0006F559F8|nr:MULTISPECIES: tRNA (adenosine(37)-N6)-threonylcarbamoyltransferase complex dimerization subunit type 1 TsaB [unclassified Nocardioides]KRA38378.1 tRNA threonylcarbamoyladenosine biosynthesis protein TsaB [Nocardioides sp. Root614]KRA92337.1 tRNA threonylcarbamoyladenosine biosynthesis protein TsaB [Nocardioides sp. Root682]